jgi:hypothetical protein
MVPPLARLERPEAKMQRARCSQTGSRPPSERTVRGGNNRVDLQDTNVCHQILPLVCAHVCGSLLGGEFAGETSASSFCSPLSRLPAWCRRPAAGAAADMVRQRERASVAPRGGITGLVGRRGAHGPSPAAACRSGLPGWQRRRKERSRDNASGCQRPATEKNSRST